MCFETYSLWRVLAQGEGIKTLCLGLEVFEHLNFFWSETPFLDKRTVKGSAPLERLVLVGATFVWAMNSLGRQHA